MRKAVEQDHVGAREILKKLMNERPCGARLTPLSKSSVTLILENMPWNLEVIFMLSHIQSK
ncbi:hypothetical protein A9Q83_04345 [Alphaproteobacteria bacterium 46_93_T64]|nr:hypothetical protein A9Q83_04345 [Alphaproteobacteria bacterium 46_93_T64]